MAQNDHKHAAKIISLYQRFAADWAAARSPHISKAQEWFDHALRLMPAAPSVLDIGCGTGDPFARYMIAQGANLTGVDSAPEMIAYAQKSMPEAAWHVVDMRQMSLIERFDGLIAWNSFFHLTPDDQRAMFLIFQAHANPNAPLMFTSGTSEGVAMGQFKGEPLYHASLEPDEYRSLLNAHGFDVIRYVAEDPNCGDHTIWLARAR